jgi:opacity protein-like surface antigen
MVIRCLVLSVCVLLSNLTAAADDRGVAVGASVSATNMDSRTSWSAAGSFEYRLNRVAGLELEATVVPKLKSDFAGPIVALQGSRVAPLIYPPPTFDNQRGRAVIFTNSVRLHVPTTTDRVDPFFIAGAGVANIRESADFTYSPFTVTPVPPQGGPLPIILPGRPIIEPFTTSSTTLALTMGGGIGVRVASQLWIEGDLRLFRLLDSDDRNLGRFAVGVRYRF